MTNASTTATSTATGDPPSSASGMSDAAKSEARSVAETGKQGAGQVAGEARTQAAQLARTAQEEARDRVDGEVGKLAAYLNGLGDELNGLAQGSPPQDGYLKGLARDGARAANGLAHRLESDGLDGVLHDVSMFARRRPGLYLAAAFAVGITLGRVTRNVDVHAITEEMQRGNGSGPNGSSGSSSQLGASQATRPSSAAGSTATDISSPPRPGQPR